MELAQVLGDRFAEDVADIFDAAQARRNAVTSTVCTTPTLKSRLLPRWNIRESFADFVELEEIAEDVIEGRRIPLTTRQTALADLPEAKVEEALRLVDDQESASEVLELLQYEEGTAGAPMGRARQGRRGLDRGEGDP